MAFIPFITFPENSQPEAEEAENVVAFPRKVVAEGNLRHAQRMVERMEEWMLYDPRSSNSYERTRALMAPDKLEEWKAEVSQAEAEVAFWSASDTLTYKGRSYQAVRSSAGAN